MANHHSYKIGDIALSCDIDTTHAVDAEAERAVASMRVGDPAFIRRSDRIWRFATVSEVSSSPPVVFFIVTGDGSTKKVGRHHWGDRVRPLKRRTSFRQKMPNYLREKSLRSSFDTQTSSFNTQSSANPQAGSNVHVPPIAIEENSSAGGSSVTDNEQRPDPPVLVRRMKRTESFKDKFIRKISGNNIQEMNHLVDDSIDALDNMKINEDWDMIEGPEVNDETELSLIKATKSDPTEKNSRQRRPSRRKSRPNLLTTSSLFKNLMKNALGNEAEDTNTKPTRPRRATVQDITDDKDDDAAGSNEDDIAPMPNMSASGRMPKPRRNLRRRATAESGTPSPATMKELCRQSSRKSKTRSTDNSPSASFVFKGAFTHLMEDKGVL